MRISAKKLLVIGLSVCTIGICQPSAETILQEFNSQTDFDAFWDIATWGNSDQQYSASNVSVDETNGLLVLKLNASPQGTTPVCGEVDSKRNDFLYGSYRASIKFDNVSGGVIGWFVYKDEPDLHEVDVEFLTEDLNFIHFTLHHIQTDVDYKKDPISFNPTTAFHEYRFDWYQDKVVYFIDGTPYDTLTNEVPDAACTIMLNIWSANIQDWGGPAPTEDMYMYVDYMRYYSDYTAASDAPVHSSSDSQADYKLVVRNGKEIIRFNNPVQQELSAQILDTSGRVVRTCKIPAGATDISLQDIGRGVHIVKLSSNGMTPRTTVVH